MGKVTRMVPVSSDDGMGALLDRLKTFQAEQPGIPGPYCKACLLPEKYRKFLTRAKAQGATCKQIAGVVTAEGHPISRGSVERHLRGDCVKR